MNRHITIIEFLRLNTYPTFDQILERLEEKEMTISQRTLERDFAYLRSKLEVVVAYDSQQRGYYIDKEQSLDLDAFFRFLKLANKANFLAESVADAKQLMTLIDFDNQGEVQGVEFLSQILTAIKEQRKLFFHYKAFYADEEKPHNYHPYLLKEYMGRWYMVGFETYWKEMRTYAVDRITQLELTGEKFKTSGREAVQKQLRTIIGVNYSETEIQTVKIRFAADQKKYELTRPWHESQTLHKELENGDAIVLYHVRPNFEFKQRILMLGENAEVMEPLWLRDEMALRVGNMMKLYKK